MSSIINVFFLTRKCSSYVILKERRKKKRKEKGTLKATYMMTHSCLEDSTHMDQSLSLVLMQTNQVCDLFIYF